MNAALADFGWQRSGGKLEVIWETPENITQAKQRVEFILSGKTGCGTKRCKCKKEGRMCGPGCQCINCTNSPSTTASVVLEAEEHTSIEVVDTVQINSEDDYTDTSCDEDDQESEIDTSEITMQEESDNEEL